MTIKMNTVVFPPVFNYPKLEDFDLFREMANAPVHEGLVGAYFLGSRNVDATYNFANAELPLIQIGSPDTSQRGYARLGRRTGYFDTQIKSAAEMTIVAISRVPVAGAVALVVSNYAKETAAKVTGDTLMNRWNASQKPESGFYAQSSETAVTSISRELAAVAGDYQVTGSIITKDFVIGGWSFSTDGTPRFSTNNMTGRATTQRTLLLGCAYSDTEFLGTSDVAAVLIYNRDIGGAQMTNTMNWLRNVIGPRAGIWE